MKSASVSCPASIKKAFAFAVALSISVVFGIFAGNAFAESGVIVDDPVLDVIEPEEIEQVGGAKTYFDLKQGSKTINRGSNKVYTVTPNTTLTFSLHGEMVGGTLTPGTIGDVAYYIKNAQGKILYYDRVDGCCSPNDPATYGRVTFNYSLEQGSYTLCWTGHYYREAYGEDGPLNPRQFSKSNSTFKNEIKIQSGDEWGDLVDGFIDDDIIGGRMVSPEFRQDGKYIGRNKDKSYDVDASKDLNFGVWGAPVSGALYSGSIGDVKLTVKNASNKSVYTNSLSGCIIENGTCAHKPMNFSTKLTPGTYTVQWTGNYYNQSEDENYIFTKSSSKFDESYTVNCYEYLRPSIVPFSGPYDGAAHAVQTNKTTESKHFIFYSDTQPLNENNFVEGSLECPTKTNVGSSTIYWYAYSNDPYCKPGSGQSMITISDSTPLIYKTTAVTKKFGDKNFINELTRQGNVSGIKYSSSNTSVAKVNAKGAVDIVGVGTATIKVTCDSSGALPAGSASYVLTVKPRAISDTTVYGVTDHVYNGKPFTPKVTVKCGSKALKKGKDYSISVPNNCKNVGTYKVTLKGKGHFSGTKTVSFQIKPKKVNGVKVKSGSGAAIHASWGSVDGATGYQVQISYKKNFSSIANTSSTSASVTSSSSAGYKSGKKAYVRVRAYAKSGSAIYGPWSTAKRVTIK